MGIFMLKADQRYDTEGKEYRVTGAYVQVGINRQDGIVYFLPEKGAGILWDNFQLDPTALPKLRCSSDLVFGLWNSVPAPNGHEFENFMSINITNEDAEEIY